jgi:ribosome-associated translation inhibitor RaiA
MPFAANRAPVGALAPPRTLSEPADVLEWDVQLSSDGPVVGAVFTGPRKSLMRRDDPSEPLHIEIDTHQCDIQAEQVARMQTDLDSLTKLVEHFPRPELHVHVERENRTNEYVVKTSLLLPGQTLVTSEHGPVLHAAWEKCVHVLIGQVKEYKARLGQVPERQKTVGGTRQPMQPTVDPDTRSVDAAVEAGDYAAFRAALQGYEEPLRDHVGRWLGRSVEADGGVGRTYAVADVVEEVFLDAFEQYEHRSADVRFGDWLASLIDPAAKELLRNPDDELENVSMARSVQAVPATREEH